MEQLDQFRKIIEEMASTYERKNKDYGNSFDKTLNKWGPNIALARLEDKLNRVDQLLKADKAEVNDESIEDTLKDMATYAIMLLIWLQNNNDRKTVTQPVEFEVTKEIVANPQHLIQSVEDFNLETKLQHLIGKYICVKKGLNNSGWNPGYVLGTGKLTSIKIRNEKVYAHFENITKSNRTVGSGTADVIYPLDNIYNFMNIKV